jgi:haloalkane dehalogenase
LIPTNTGARNTTAADRRNPAMNVDFVPDPALYPFEPRWFESSAGRMHYLDEGTGPTILFCHGNPMWSFLYRHLIVSLRGQFRCVAADLHGFGLSERPDAGFGYTAAEHVATLGELVDHLDLSDFVVMGQDWGGPTGLGVATQRAERVRGVVLGNTWFWRATPLFRAFSLAAGSPPGQWLIRNRNAFVEGFVPRGMARELSPAEMHHYRAVQPNAAARAGIAAFPSQIRFSPLLATLECAVVERLGSKPALIVWGMRDWGFRERDRARVRAAFRDHVFLELPSAAHYIQEDAPTEIAEAIIRRFC